MSHPIFHLFGDAQIWESGTQEQAKQQCLTAIKNAGRFIRWIHVRLDRVSKHHILATVHLDIAQKPLLNFTVVDQSPQSALQAVFTKITQHYQHYNKAKSA